MLSSLFLPLKWNVKAVTMTGTAVKRSKNETWLSKWGSILGVSVFPSRSAEIAIAELMPTNTTASRTDIAELNFNDSGDKHQCDEVIVSKHLCYEILRFTIPSF